MTSTVLIIEDDQSLVEILRYNLRQSGYAVSAAGDGPEGLTQAQSCPPDLVILDLMLPGLDGLEVCRQLRSDPRTAAALILMLTARSEETDQLVGFAVGADDYVTKPFSVRVLIERLKALQRRRGSSDPAEADVVTRAGISVDRRSHRARRGDQLLDLTRCEFRLLDTLIRQPGRAFQRSELINAALGEDTIVLERTIDVHIRAIRRKLGAAAEAVETVRGVGYRFRELPAESPGSHGAC